MFTIDWTISVGNLLTMLFIVGGGIGAYFNLKSDVRIIKHDFSGLKHSFEMLSETATNTVKLLTAVAVQDQTLKGFEVRVERSERDIEMLRRGDGFVLNPTRGAPVHKP